MRGRPFLLVKERVNLAIGESNLCDAAIEYDDLFYDGIDEALELRVPDLHCKLGEVNAAVRH